MYAAFEFELGVRTVALDHERNFLEAAEFGFIGVDYLGLEALLSRVHGVHTVEHACKQRRFFTAGTAAYLDDYVLVIVGVARQKQYFQLFEDLFECFLAFEHFHFGKLAQFCFDGFVGDHFFGIGDGLCGAVVFTELFDNRCEMLMFLHQRAVFFLVTDDSGVG